MLEPKNREFSLKEVLDEDEIPFLKREDLLVGIKELINKKVLKHSDKYFRLRKGFLPQIHNNHSTKTTPGDFRVEVYSWSDSAVFYDVYHSGGAEMPTSEFLNTCGDHGAYTKQAWLRYFEKKTLTPQDLMEIFRIEAHIKPVYLASGSYEECLKASALVYEWNRSHIASNTEMIQDATLNFMRVTRKKGEIESTQCMNGDCIGVIFARETAF